MIAVMESELRMRYYWYNPYDLVYSLNTRFASQVRVMRYEYLDKFFSTMMEEKTCLESHLETMHEIHGHLTVDLDYEMTDSLAVHGVLRSLPPSYKDVVMATLCKGIQSPSVDCWLS